MMCIWCAYDNRKGSDVFLILKCVIIQRIVLHCAYFEQARKQACKISPSLFLLSVRSFLRRDTSFQSNNLP